MVQSDIPKGQTSSGKINARWYLQRLKASAANRTSSSSSKQTIRIVKGSTHNNQQHIPTIYLRSLSHKKKKSNENNRSNSLDIKSASSLKSLSTLNPNCSSLSEFNSTSYQSSKRSRRPSSDSLSLLKSDLIVRPPSTPVDQRCQRAYSTRIEPIQRETCQLLGPDLCSDCIENEIRSNLSPEFVSKDFIRQRLSSLAIRSFLPNSNQFDDQQLLQFVQNQQIQLKQNLRTPSIPTDEQYFDDLTRSIRSTFQPTPFYYKHFQDFTSKYRSNQYPRLLLSENPSPTSSNPIFQQDAIDKFNVSTKYSFMKKASTTKYDFNSNLSTFISPKKSDKFHQEHRYLTNYSPPLLKHSSQQFTKQKHKSFSTHIQSAV